jgi:hypothetical protein
MKRVLRKKGQMESLVTFPVLIYVFLIMLIFVIVAFFAVKLHSTDRESDNFVKSPLFVDEQVPIEVFLNDFVVIDGKKNTIRNVLIEMADKEDEELAALIQRKFDFDYSCKGRNKLFVEGETGEKESPKGGGGVKEWKRIVYINYPEKLEVGFIPGKYSVAKRSAVPPFEAEYLKKLETGKEKEINVAISEEVKCPLSDPIEDEYEEVVGGEDYEGVGVQGESGVDDG